MKQKYQCQICGKNTPKPQFKNNKEYCPKCLRKLIEFEAKKDLFKNIKVHQ